MKHSFFLIALLCGGSFLATSQIPQKQKPIQRTDTQSVVIIPESQRPEIDSATLKPGKVKRRRRFEVKVVPVPPPGRSRQEILYTDSLGR